MASQGLAHRHVWDGGASRLLAGIPEPQANQSQVRISGLSNLTAVQAARKLKWHIGCTGTAALGQEGEGAAVPASPA